MKNKLFYLCLILIIGWQTNSSAQCYLLQDSITGGDNAQSYTNYRYGMNWRIIGSEIIDSAQTTVGRYDTIYYNLNGLTDSIVKYNMYMGVAYWSQKTAFTYNGFNKISRIDVQGIQGTNTWSMSHDLYYNGGAELIRIALDNASITGQPEGLQATFDSIVWSNGNPISMNLIADFTGSLDTFELLVNFDNKLNRKRLTYIDGMGNILEFLAQNNLTSVVLANDEVLGTAGTFAMLNTYTYHPMNEVETRIEHPGLFNDQDSSVHQYLYDCVTATPKMLATENSVQIYPNPFENQLIVDFGDFAVENSSLRLSAIDGSIIYNQTTVNQSIIEIDGLNNLPAGVYILTIQNDNQIISKKLIK